MLVSMCACVCMRKCVHACVCACGGVTKWLKRLTTDQKVPGSSPTMHVCVCIMMYRIQCVLFH